MRVNSAKIQSEAARTPVLGGEIGVEAGERAAVVERDQLGDVGVDVVGGDLLERGGDGGVGGARGDGLLGGGGEGGSEDS